MAEISDLMSVDLNTIVSLLLKDIEGLFTKITVETLANSFSCNCSTWKTNEFNGVEILCCLLNSAKDVSLYKGIIVRNSKLNE